MGEPGVYSPELAPLPEELKNFRKNWSSFLAGQTGQGMEQYGGDLGPAIQQPYTQAQTQLQALGMAQPGAYDYLGQMLPEAIGNAQYTPDILNTAAQTATRGMGQGAVTQDPIYQAAREKMLSDLQYDTAGINRYGNLTGSRYSSGNQRAIGEAVSKRSLEEGLNYANATAQALENARNRQLGAAQLGNTIGTTQYMLPYQGLESAGNLALGLGKGMNDVMQGRMELGANMGLQEQQLYQNALDKQYAAWQAAQWWNNPMLGYASQYALGYPSGTGAPTIAENPLTSILGGLMGGIGTGIGRSLAS